MRLQSAARLLRALPLALALIGAQCAAANAWQPVRDVEFVVPFGVGGGADLLARSLVKIIQDNKLVPVNIAVVNKPGGGTSVGVSYVAATRGKDPHTIVLINPQTVLTPLTVPDSLGWRALRPVSNLMLDDYLILAAKSSPYGNIGDVVKAAQQKGDRAISIGSSGTADDLAIALLEQATKVRFNVVRFNGGGQIMSALLGGHIDLGAGNPLEFLGQIKSGDMRALAVLRDDRFPQLPDVPTLVEQNFRTRPFQMWRGIASPKGVPDDAVEYWDGVFKKVAATPDFKKYLELNSATFAYMDSKQFPKFLDTQEKFYSEMLELTGAPTK